MSTDYADLSATDLAKLITEEYEDIEANEKTIFQKALSLGEKLIALRQRVKHGEWQTKLEGYCPSVSYETATLYIRFVENLPKLEAYAAAKNVTVTDLGIREAQKALTKSRPTIESVSDSESESDDENGVSEGKPTPEAMKAREAANAEEEAAAAEKHIMDMPIRWLINLEPEDMFEMLMQVYPQDGGCPAFLLNI